MSRVETSLDHKRVRRLIWLVLTVFILLIYSLQSVAGNAYYSMLMQNSGTASSPPVILQNGTAGTSTIYANKTSAKASVEAPLIDYVDNNDPDVDSSADKGMHSNFTAQQAGPDSTYDTLAEENTEAIEDYVDSNTSDMDNSSDLGTHSNFENQKAQDSSYDTLTEASQANTYSLDATGGYMIIGDGTPDWGSTTGTISFWVKMDSSVQGRFYGQDGNMETRWSGTNLVLDWGGTASMTSAYSFSFDTWYFVAIVWDENNNNLFLYVGDENNAPILDSNSLSGTWTSTTPVPTENRFMNGLGGNETVDGHGDDLRYWNIARSLTEIQSDYNETLSGSEPNLQSYFKLDNNFDDIGPNDDDGSGSGSYSFSTDVPFSGSSDYDLDIEIQWTSVIDFLPTEKLCIYTGTLGDEDLRVDYWNGTGWENLATDLGAHSCNEYAISLTSTTLTIRFVGGTTGGDLTQDQWQIDASLLRVEGAGSKEDAIDNDTSNEDGSADVGTLSNFDNMKTKDGMANLTEGEVGGGTVWLWQEDTSGYSSTSSYETYQFWNSWTTNSTTSGTITKIGIYVFANPGNSPQVKLGIYDDSGGSPNNLLGETNAATITGAGWLDLDIVGSGVNISASTTYHIAHITNIAPTTQWRYIKTATPVSDYRNNRVWPNLFDPAGTTTKSASYRYGAYRVGYDEPPDYRLDQEVQWTDLPYLLPNENLSIYGGTMGTEDIRVDVWNGTGWETVFTDLSSGWNNASVTDWLTTSNFTIRFKGGNETGDPSQDTWQIDVALIHIWHEGGENYQLDLEVQWTNADYTRTNEKLCIRTGTFSGSENVQVRVWNNTGSSWHWVMNLTASQWNNVSITSYLISSTFTVQFLGGTETGDTTQDSWSIDATLFHVGTAESTYDYVDNNTSNVGSPIDIGTHSNFTAQQYGPDSIHDTLTEENTGVVSNVTIIEDWESGSIASENWTTYSSAAQGRIVVDTDTPYEGSYALWMDVDTSGTYSLNELITNFDFSGATQVLLDFYHNEQGDENEAGSDHTDHQNADGVYYTLDGSYWYHLVDLVDPSGWTNVNINVTADPDFQGPVNSSFAIKFTQYDNWPRTNDGRGFENINITYQTSGENYELDLEVQWTDASYLLPNKELCIRTGATGTEDVKVDVWNETEWINVLTNLTPNSWNNVSASSYLTSSNFTIRFKGGNETNDNTQDTWNIDAALLHVWTLGTYDYVLRVNNTVVDSWQIRLKKYADTNISRLQNCEIYFHNSTDGTSSQIYIQNGLYTNQTGPWCDLGGSETIYIAIKVQANSPATSYIYTYLEILTPDTSTYAQYIITFEIT